jgi:hypothetical protein
MTDTDDEITGRSGDGSDDWLSGFVRAFPLSWQKVKSPA